MPKTVTVSFKAPVELIEQLDELVRSGVFSNRSEALRHALVMLVARYRGAGLVDEAEGQAVKGGRGAAVQA